MIQYKFDMPRDFEYFAKHHPEWFKYDPRFSPFNRFFGSAAFEEYMSNMFLNELKQQELQQQLIRDIKKIIHNFNELSLYGRGSVEYLTQQMRNFRV